MRSQHFPQGMKIPTCSALYRKIFARTGNRKWSGRHSTSGKRKGCLSLQCLQEVSLPFQAAVGSNSAVLKARITSHLSAFMKRDVLLNWGLGTSMVCIFIFFFKYLNNKQTPWYDKDPLLLRNSNWAAVSFFGAESTNVASTLVQALRGSLKYYWVKCSDVLHFRVLKLSVCSIADFI